MLRFRIHIRYVHHTVGIYCKQICYDIIFRNFWDKLLGMEPKSPFNTIPSIPAPEYFFAHQKHGLAPVRIHLFTFLLSAQIFLVVVCHAFLINRTVPHRSFRLGMSCKDHGFLQRHTPIQRIRNCCSPEAVWMRLFNLRFSSDPPDNVLNAVLQSAMLCGAFTPTNRAGFSSVRLSRSAGDTCSSGH